MKINVNKETRTALQKMGLTLDFKGRWDFRDAMIIEPPVAFEKPISGSVFVGAFTYIRSSQIDNCMIGRYCSIASGVVIGNAGAHPRGWFSTSPVFYTKNIYGWDDFINLPENYKRPQFNTTPKLTIIGNDVWIGEGAKIRDGIKIGNGADIGMGANVVSDVPAYAVVAGNPARILYYKHTPEKIQALLETEWWQYSYKDMPNVDFSNADSVLSFFKATALKKYSPQVISNARAAKFRTVRNRLGL